MPNLLYKDYVVRPNTLDTIIVDELKTYAALPLKKTDTVLDIGGNIGVFSKYAMGLVKKVIAIEPEPDNFRFLKVNSPDSINVQAAVVGDDHRGDITLFVNEKGKNKGSHTLMPTRGRPGVQVKTIAFSNLLSTYKPTKLKIDCEGAEYMFLEPLKLPSYVKGVVMELHFKNEEYLAKARKVHREFLEAGFKPTVEPKLEMMAFMSMTTVCYRR